MRLAELLEERDLRVEESRAPCPQEWQRSLLAPFRHREGVAMSSTSIQQEAEPDEP